MTLETFLLVFVALQVFDALSTYLVLTNGGRELNPVLNKVMEQIGIIPGLIQMKLLFIIVLYFFGTAYPIHEFAYYAVIAIYQIIIFNNFRVYIKLRRYK